MAINEAAHLSFKTLVLPTAHEHSISNLEFQEGIDISYSLLESYVVKNVPLVLI